MTKSNAFCPFWIFPLQGWHLRQAFEGCVGSLEPPALALGPAAAAHFFQARQWAWGQGSPERWAGAGCSSGSKPQSKAFGAAGFGSGQGACCVGRWPEMAGEQVAVNKYIVLFVYPVASNSRRDFTHNVIQLKVYIIYIFYMCLCAYIYTHTHRLL